MNLDIYTSEMAKSIWDKAFFMDKIPGVKCVIDFGCADGAMIHFLAPLFPDITFVGYDISAELIDKARKTPSYYANTVYFDGSTKYGDQHVIDFVKPKFKPEEICINFSSVLHEVFSKTPEDEWIVSHMINALKPKFITIRDMYFEGEDRVLSYYGVKEIVTFFNVKEHFIEDFEDKFGSINTIKSLHHFLMKYQWRDNGWYEEMQEDYFAWNIKDFVNLIGSYDIIFENHYMLPHYREQWYEHGLYPVEANTHAQFILRRDN